MIDPIPALLAATIWSLTPIYYKGLLKRTDYLRLNAIRTAIGGMVLVLPGLLLGFQAGDVYGVLSGVMTLAIGDSLFFIAIDKIGASVATPIAYTYVMLVQFTGLLLEETVSSSNFVGAGLIVAAVLLLSGGGGKSRRTGVLYAMAASGLWTAGQSLTRVATNMGAQPISVAAARNLSAALALLIAFLSRPERGRNLRGDLTGRDFIFFTVVAACDLGIASIVYVSSVAAAGVGTTSIITSVAPLLTQLISRGLGREAPTRRDIFGALLIVLALVVVAV